MSDTFLFVGGGVGSVPAAYELQYALHQARHPEKVTLITDRFNSPIVMGASHVTRGIDGLGEGDEPHPLAPQFFHLTQMALRNIERRAALEIGQEQSGLVMGYHFLGNNKAALRETRAWLHDFFGYGATRMYAVASQNKLRFEGFPHALYTAGAGQLNAQPFLTGLAEKILEYGGQVLTETTYLSHEEQDGHVVVNTTKGEFRAAAVHIATGPEHALQLGLPGSLIWTGASHWQLSRSDCDRYFPNGPVAFIDSRGMTEDVTWGGADIHDVLTLGRGDQESADGAEIVKTDLINSLREMAPDLANKYAGQEQFSWNPIFYTPNSFPYAGRVSDSGRVMINFGWGGRAFTPSFVYANAVVDFYLRRDDSKLRLLESTNLDALRKEVREPPRSGQLFGKPKPGRREP